MPFSLKENGANLFGFNEALQRKCSSFAKVGHRFWWSVGSRKAAANCLRLLSVFDEKD